MPLLTGARKPSARWLVPALALAAALFVALPAFGFSTGITKENAPDAAGFAKDGCTSCHGTLHTFAALNMTNVVVSVAKTDGTPLNGPYEAHAVYVISIRLNEQNVPTDPTNHAGFNLRAAAGKLTAVDGQSQVTADGTQATHTSPLLTAWQVGWEAPESGAAGFSLYVNDVDGSKVPDPADQVYWLQFGFGDHEGAVLGAAVHEEVEFGISLQQYWIGLIGLAGMLFVVVASFVYIKFVNPHNTDQKDR
ncbi:MAG: choice-of-anchor V domain-containing protein [Candidatus Thermoplasmatota archaeon]